MLRICLFKSPEPLPIIGQKETNMLKEWFSGREVELPKPLSQLSPASPAHGHKSPCKDFSILFLLTLKRKPKFMI